MTLKTYQAYSMAEALAAVKRDLGSDAVILNTRCFKRGGFLGIGAKNVFEVTATTAEQASGRRALLTNRARSRGGASVTRAVSAARTKSSVVAGAAPGDPRATHSSIRPSHAVSEKVEQMYAELIAGVPKPGPLRLEESGEYALESSDATDPGETRAEPASPATSSPAKPASTSTTARRYVLSSSKSAGGGGSVQKGESAQPAAHVEVKPRSANGSMETRRMSEELTLIRDMVGRVLKQQVDAGGGGVGAMPKQLFEMYLRMVSQDLSEELAEQVVTAVRSGLTEDELEDPATVHEAVLQQLAAFIPVAREPMTLQRPEDRPLVIALVGPTGVGKTTTVAKLAAAYKLKHGKRVALVTADTYRIAAVEQLRTYADIIGVPLEVVLTPGEMNAAIEKLEAYDVVLIDTAGRGQHNASRLDELRGFLEAAEPDETHLVLSSTAGERVMFSEAEAFAPLGVQRVVLTKLDEAVSFGVIVSVVRRIEKELSFLTTGQEVPDHLEPGRPERLARLILGDDDVE